MFTGKIIVRKLCRSEVSQEVIDDINHLLRKQHSRARKVDEENLLSHLKRSKVVVGWDDNSRIIAFGVMVRTYVVSHTFASIHNLTVRDDFDRLSICKRMVDLLMEGANGVEFIEISVSPEDDDLINIATTLGFVLRPKLRYRHRIRKT